MDHPSLDPRPGASYTPPPSRDRDAEVLAAHAAAIIPDLEQLVAEVPPDNARQVALVRQAILNLLILVPVLTPAIQAFLDQTAP